MGSSRKLPVILGLVLSGVWLLWSGHFTPLLLSLGAVSVLAVVLVTVRMRIVDEEGAPTRLPGRAVLYLPWLFWEIFKANVHVAGRILAPGMPIHPTVIRVRPGQKTDLGRVVYANSITLTPGTVSLAVEEDEIVVHALTREAAEGLQGGEMDRRATAYEGCRRC